MTASAARRSTPQPLLAAGNLLRRVIASLFPVRPERRPDSLPALPPARKVIVIKPDPERYGTVRDIVREPNCPFDTSLFPALTDEVIAELDALRGHSAELRETLAASAPGGVPGVFEMVRAARTRRTAS